MENKGEYLPSPMRERLLDLMRENKLTQTELAAQIGYRQCTQPSHLRQDG